MTESEQEAWESIRDHCGWMFGGIISMTGLLLIMGGAPPSFAPAAFWLGLSILPPVVDTIRRFVPYWRWTFVPTGAFLLGLVILVAGIVVENWPKPQTAPAASIDADANG